MQDRLLFLISTPRSGSTLLMRILNATSQIYSRPESHIFPALAHLGFYETVEKAPYDQLQAQDAIRDFVQELPNGEETYYEACRAYSDCLLSNMLAVASNGEKYYLEKTPANALVLPFLTKIYPTAKYIVLTRHPAAIFASYANSFFDGDYQAALAFNPILSRYVPAIANFLRQKEVSFAHVSYEQLSTNPTEVLQQISSYLEIPYEPQALNYKSATVSKGLGDPIGVDKHERPVATSIHKWAQELASDKTKLDTVTTQLKWVSSDDLSTWGYPIENLWEPMKSVDSSAYQSAKKDMNRYGLTRKALVWLRKDIHNRSLGNMVKRVRYYCDVLLRG